MAVEEWIRSGLDLTLIVLVGIGLIQATRLIWHLAGLRASRGDMERFVREFNATVIRAENGVKNLKTTARESGDDLEKLVERAMMVRDELNFIVDSADQLADRLTEAATSVSGIGRLQTKVQDAKNPAHAAPATAAAPPPEAAPAPEAPKTAPIVTPLAARREPEAKQPSSRAEKELMQALQKLN
jgi:pyruvate/2-oxoglutarate dehydrogenase complex dihydrolipoamide acyltransferase (E2) component